MKGSLLTEAMLWIFFLIPGLIYSIWRHSTVYDGCGKCGAATVIPLDSPVAKKILPEVTSLTPPVRGSRFHRAPLGRSR